MSSSVTQSISAMRVLRPLAGIAVLILGVLCFLRPVFALAQELAHRLVLKDGSYQLVTKYEVKGDRVRYLSAERNEWEELPTALVDWPATEKFEKDRAAGAPPPEAVELDKELEAEQKAEELKTPQVAPGLRLSEDGGVWLLDNFQGQPQLVEIQQNSGEINRNMKGNILRGAINPIHSTKQTIELQGQHAAVQSHVTVPSIYVNEEAQAEAEAEPGKPQQPEQPQLPVDRFQIVRVQTKGDKRIVGDIKIAIYGKVSQESKAVKTTTQPMTSGWIKVTPTESLTPGEYAVVEMLGKEGMNLFVWDFGVNPSAPANVSAVKPGEREPAKPKADR